MQSWDCINTHDDPNSMWCAWKNIFFTVIDRHAPSGLSVFELQYHLGLHRL